MELFVDNQTDSKEIPSDLEIAGWVSAALAIQTDDYHELLYSLQLHVDVQLHDYYKNICNQNIFHSHTYQSTNIIHLHNYCSVHPQLVRN